VHGTPECLGTGPFEAKHVSFVIIPAPLMWVPRAWLELRTIIPWAMSKVLTGHLAILGGRRLRNHSVRRSFPHLEPLGWPSVPHP
jgi:hypothetical protein